MNRCFSTTATKNRGLILFFACSDGEKKTRNRKNAFGEKRCATKNACCAKRLFWPKCCTLATSQQIICHARCSVRLVIELQTCRKLLPLLEIVWPAVDHCDASSYRLYCGLVGQDERKHHRNEVVHPGQNVSIRRMERGRCTLFFLLRLCCVATPLAM